eukprot:2796408-Amphidinium_carterae.1
MDVCDLAPSESRGDEESEQMEGEAEISPDPKPKRQKLEDDAKAWTERDRVVSATTRTVTTKNSAFITAGQDLLP